MVRVSAQKASRANSQMANITPGSPIAKKELQLFGHFKSQMCCKSYSMLRYKKSEEVKKKRISYHYIRVKQGTCLDNARLFSTLAYNMS